MSVEEVHLNIENSLTNILTNAVLASDAYVLNVRNTYLLKCYLPHSNDFTSYVNAISNYEIVDKLKLICAQANLPAPTYNIAHIPSVYTFKCDGCDTPLQQVNSYEMQCTKCGDVTIMSGCEMRENIQKGTGAEATAYIKKSLDRICGRDGKLKYPKQEILPRIKRSLLQRSISNKRQLHADLIRECLRENGLSRYNNCVPSIISDLTNTDIIEIDDELYESILEQTIQATRTYHNICSHKKRNTAFIQYFILKLFENKLINDPKKMAKIRNLIHIQEYATTSRNDKGWLIISKSMGIEFQSTKYDYIY